MRSRHARAAWLTAWAAVLPVALMRASYLAESDTFWEIRTGQLILRTGHIPTADSFSWWAHGRPWTPNSWLFDVLLGLCYPAGGLTCVALAGSVLVLAVGAAVLLLAWQLGSSPCAAAMVAVAGMLGISGWLSVRPQLTDYIAVPVLLVVMARAGTAPRAGHLLMIAVIEAVWVNLHTAAPLGIAVVACAGLGAQIASPVTRSAYPVRRRAVRAGTGILLPVAAALAGTLVNPHGAAVFWQLVSVAGSSTGLIAEWQPISITSPAQLSMLAIGILAVVAAARRDRWDLAIVLVLLAVGGIDAIRILPVLDVVAIAVLAPCLCGPRMRAWLTDRGRAVILGVGLAAVFAVLIWRATIGLPHLGETPYPIGSVRALPAGCRLFNEYTLGGIVILLRPDVPVSLDSRNDLYGRQDVLTEQRILTSSSGGAGTLRRLGVNCALIPASSGLARQLRADPDWRLVTRDQDGAAFVVRRWFASRPGP